MEPGCVLVRMACHSAAMLFCSARTSSLETLTTCSVVAVRHGPSAALAMPGAGHSTVEASTRAVYLSKRYVNIFLKSQYPTKLTLAFAPSVGSVSRHKVSVEDTLKT